MSICTQSSSHPNGGAHRSGLRKVQGCLGTAEGLTANSKLEIKEYLTGTWELAWVSSLTLSRVYIFIIGESF